MEQLGFTGRLALWSARHRLPVLIAWIVLFVVGGALSAGVADVLNNDQRQTNDPESLRAQKLLEDRGLRDEQPLEEIVLIHSDTLTVDDGEFEELVSDLVGDLRALDGHILFATSFFETGAPGLVSENRSTTLVPATLNGTIEDATDASGALLELLRERQDEHADFVITSSGFGTTNEVFTELSEEDLKAELYALPVAFLILIIVFGALAAAPIPMIVAFFAIVIATGGAALIGRVWPLSFFITNFILSIGLAVGIDYSLFIVGRFREERARGLERYEAIAVAGNTAARAVLFSGITVIIALLGMFLVPQAIFRSLATGAILVAGLAVLASLTLQPAILAFMGDGVNRFRIPFISHAGELNDDRGFWAAGARFVMKYRVPSAILAAGLLVALSLSYWSINLGFAGPSTLPEGSEPRTAFELLSSEFSAGEAIPAEIVIDAPDVSAPEIVAGVDRLREALVADPAFGSPQTVIEARDTLMLQVPLTVEFASPEERDTIVRLREQIIPAALGDADAQVLVGGIPGGNADFFGMVDDYTPIVVGFVLALSFVLLLLVFRSLVVPIKAIIMNLLSVGAAYGLLVLVFQEGVGADLLGFQTVETIEAWIPLFLFTILFGLSMDYHVFLLSRIRERYDQTGDNNAAVAFGLRSTANIITGAAAIMIAVFGGFAMGQLVPFQQMGFGLAVAILIDATIVRTILVPSTMAMLGDWNWYLPSWLRWLPDLRVEGGPGEPVPVPVTVGVSDTAVRSRDDS